MDTAITIPVLMSRGPRTVLSRVQVGRWKISTCHVSLLKMFVRGRGFTSSVLRVFGTATSRSAWLSSSFPSFFASAPVLELGKLVSEGSFSQLPKAQKFSVLTPKVYRIHGFLFSAPCPSTGNVLSSPSSSEGESCQTMSLLSFPCLITG